MHVFSKVNIMTGLFFESGVSTGFPKNIFTDICRCASIIVLDFCRITWENIMNVWQEYVQKMNSLSAGACEQMKSRGMWNLKKKIAGVCEVWTATQPANHRLHWSGCEGHSKGFIKCPLKTIASELIKSWFQVSDKDFSITLNAYFIVKWYDSRCHPDDIKCQLKVFPLQNVIHICVYIYTCSFLAPEFGI